MAVVAAVCVPAMSAMAQGRTGKTIGGVTTIHTEWRRIPTFELQINIADLPRVAVTDAQARRRNNRAFQQRAKFDGRRSSIFIEHFPSTLLDLRSTQYYNDRANTKKRADKYFYGHKLEYQASVKIYAYGELGGWAYKVLSRDTNQTCIFALAGFLSDVTKNRTVDEHYDTDVRVIDCSETRSMEEVVSFFRLLKIVPSEYNRARMGGD